MAKMTYDKESTAVLVSRSVLIRIDPYNDFISEEGKVWDRLRFAFEFCDEPSRNGHNTVGVVALAVIYPR